MSLRKAILITGPTATGKSELAMRLYDRLGGEKSAQLISVDSAMVYKGLNIGTAKPSETTLKQYPHSLIDVREPEENYSVADFVRDADQIVNFTISESRTPILVGGTMLYIKCFRDGISQLPSKNESVRKNLEDKIFHHGLDALYQELEAVDPEAAKNIHPNNRQRIVRALEVFQITGKKISTLWIEEPSENVTKRLGCGLNIFAVLPKHKIDLDKRINDRFIGMLDGGFLEEVIALKRNTKLSLICPSMKSVGYRQAWRYLDGVTDRAGFVDEAIKATKSLAKKQMTWLRAWHDVETVLMGDDEDTYKRIEYSLEGG